MGLLSYIFAEQQHKTHSGYYLNHDNLLPLTPEQRKKLIYFFIAEQTPEKLSVEDRAIYETEREKRLTRWTQCNALTFSLLGVLSPPIRSATRNYWVMNTVWYLTKMTFFYAMGHNVAHVVNESRFVATNKVVEAMAQKYNFSVYDFALAKKESRLKSLRREMSADFDPLRL